MPQNLNIVIVLEPPLSLSGRRQLVRRLFDIGEECLGRPATVARNDWKDGTSFEVPWTREVEILGKRLGHTTLLHVYAEGGKLGKSSLMVEELAGATQLVLSVPLPSLCNASLKEIEHTLLTLYHECSHHGECVIGTGPELTLELATSIEGALAELSDNTLVTCVIASARLMPYARVGFAVVEHAEGVQVFRHIHAESRLRSS
jgi:hypothetical protein